MKRYALLTVTAVLALNMFGSGQSVRGRQNSGSGTPSQSTRTVAPSRSTAPAASSGSAAQRPGNSSGSAAQRPGNSNPPSSGNAAQRPGNSNPPSSGNAAQRPGNSNPPSSGSATQRPGNSNPPSSGNAAQRPGTPNTRPVAPPPAPSRPTPPPPQRPQGYNPGYHYVPPRPYTPPHYTYYRPTPPPSWRPTINTPTFGSFLGLTLGAVLSNSINYLFNNGYHVSGYTSDRVYLNNVNFCNMTWPDVTMYYNNGYLQGTLFSNYSVSYDPSRYNYAYSYLTGLYGYPVSNQNLSQGGMSSTWWGRDNTYITLSFYPEYIAGYGVRYFTTISMGR